MAVQALMDLPLTDTQKFVLREDMYAVNLLKESSTKKCNCMLNLVFWII